MKNIEKDNEKNVKNNKKNSNKITVLKTMKNKSNKKLTCCRPYKYFWGLKGIF